MSEAEKHPMVQHLSVEEVELVRNYMSFVISALGLGENFQIIIRTETAEEYNDGKDGTLAAVEVHETKFSADLFLAEEWEDFTDMIKSTSLIHEAVHILHKRVDMAVYDHLDIDWIPLRLSEAGKSLYMREMEMVVDRVTRALSAYFPPWTDAAQMLPLASVVVQGEHF